MHLPDESSICYVYDAQNLLKVVRKFKEKGEKGKKVDKDYFHKYLETNLCGKSLKSQLIGNAGVIFYSWDLLLRNRSVSSKNWSLEIPEDGLDDVGNLLKMKVFEGEDREEVDFSFEYDSLNQIVKEKGLEEHEYSYDSISHRLSKEYFLTEMLEVESDGELSYKYDDNGNTESVLELEGRGSGSGNGNGSRKEVFYSYDAKDRLASVENVGESRVDYFYDTFDRRISKVFYYWERASKVWIENGKEDYLYVGLQEIGAVNEAGEIFQLQVLGKGDAERVASVVSIELDGVAYAPIYDQRGSLCCLIDSQTGEVARNYYYTSFGENVGGSRAGRHEEALSVERGKELIDSPWKFSNKRLDKESGLYYFGKRFYNPSIGRWITQDPSGFSDGPNLYAYVHNRPLQCFDRFGLFTEYNYQDMFLTSPRIRSDKSEIINFDRTISCAEFDPKEYARICKERSSRSDKAINYRYFTESRKTHDLIIGKIPGKENPNLKAMFGNGIGNKYFDAESVGLIIQGCLGGFSVDIFCHQTVGSEGDFLSASFEKRGMPSTETKMLEVYMREQLIDLKKNATIDDPTLFVFVHSRGAAELYNATKNLPKDLQNMLYIVTLGPLQRIPEGNYKKVINYENPWDFVPKGSLGSKKNYNIVDTGYRTLNALGNHYVTSPGYMNAIKKECRKILREGK